jgi:phosphoglycolate phosphatase-like HAD superfamily hydrolase
MPGVVELLERLTGEGRLVGLITGNTEPAAHVKLARADLNRFFTFGGYGSDANQRVDVCRKALDRAEIAAGGNLDRAGSIATGDTPRDVEAGHGAGIRVVGVATGEYSVEQLGEAGGDWVVSDLTAADLPY